MSRVLSPAQLDFMRTAARDGTVLADWYLAGGTALALRYEHRVSEDFDFFRSQPFAPLPLAATLTGTFPGLKVIAAAANTLHADIGGVRVSFLQLAPALLERPEMRDGLHLAGDRDIAAMKLSALGGRGARKDFVDLYLLGTGALGFEGIIAAFEQRFASLRVDRAHFLRSLVYFNDAEAEPMPRLLRDWSWATIRAWFEGEIARVISDPGSP